ncbi:hypothetical protein ACLOJK_022402 [Asimina triloba]
MFGVFGVVPYELFAGRNSVDCNLPRLLLKALSRIIDSLDEEKPHAAIETHDIKEDAAGSAETRKEGTKEETRDDNECYNGRMLWVGLQLQREDDQCRRGICCCGFDCSYNGRMIKNFLPLHLRLQQLNRRRLSPFWVVDVQGGMSKTIGLSYRNADMV